MNKNGVSFWVMQDIFFGFSVPDQDPGLNWPVLHLEECFPVEDNTLQQ